MPSKNIEGRFLVRLAQALNSTMDESEWKRFAMLHSLENRILEHPRFLRSLQWGDSDHEGHVLDLVRELHDSENIEALDDLVRTPAVEEWFKGNHGELLAYWKGVPDPLVEAISHGLRELDSVEKIADLSSHRKDIEAALPANPRHAIGATKDLVEAAMRTILTRAGEKDVESLDFGLLATRCFTELGLTGSTQPSSLSDGKIRRIANKAREILITANELRNIAGSGHGKAAGTEENVDPDDASMIASIGMILTAWLIRRSEQ